MFPDDEADGAVTVRALGGLVPGVLPTDDHHHDPADRGLRHL